MVTKFIKEECVEEVSIGNVVIILLLYADDVVLLANTLGNAQKLMKALEIVFMHTKLSVNSSKTKIMLVKNTTMGLLKCRNGKNQNQTYNIWTSFMILNAFAWMVMGRRVGFLHRLIIPVSTMSFS